MVPLDGSELAESILPLIGLSRVLLGSVAEAVLRGVEIPLFLFRHASAGQP